MTDHEMLDRMRIRHLMEEYAEIIDSRRFDELHRVFTPDAHIDYTAFGGIAGNLAEIIAFLKTSMAQFVRHQHMLGNSVLEIAGDSASGRTQCHNPMVSIGPDGREHVMFLGLWYIDTFVRQAGEWKIATRSQEVCFAHNVPEQVQLQGDGA